MASKKLTDLEEPLNVLYYGDGGTGKTTHLCHMADLGPVVVVNAESGVKRRALERCGVDTSNIELFPEPGVKLTYDLLEGEWLRVREALAEDPTAYSGFIWDSISEVYKVLLEETVADLEKKAERTGKNVDPREKYGETNEQVRRLVRKARDLPCHFGASALERRDIDEQDSSVMYRPAISPSLMTDLYGWFDLVAHTTVEEIAGEEQYRGTFKPIGKYRGKDRYGVMPRILVSPTFDRVLAYVEESLEAKSDPVMIQAQEQIDKTKTSKEAEADAEAQ